MAQEVAHTLGLWWHTFTPGSPYPRPDGTIESDAIGIDLRGPQPVLVIGSTPVYDIMSYEENTWTSVFTYLKLLAAIPSAFFSGIVQLFYRGKDNSLYSRWRNPDGSWSGEQHIGGVLNGDPIAAVVPG